MATTAFSSLAVPTHEDSMDMSSPAHANQHDTDLDIDFGYDDTLVDDDQMVDDEPTRPGTAPDAEMNDGADQDVTLVQEADMVDDASADVADEQVVDAPPDEDDELIDYGDDDDYILDDRVQDAEPKEPAVKVLTTTATEQHQDTIAEPGEGEIVHQVDDAAVKSTEPVAVLERVSQADAGQEITREEYQATDAARDVGEPAHERHAVEVTEVAVEPEDEYHDREEHSIADGEVDQAATMSINTALARASEGPATPTDTGLHPMILQYRDTKLPLFRSRHQPEGLLTNDNLAGHHLADMISSCRVHLEERAGSVFSENQEFTLRFEGLPLKLRESSKAAYSSTLNDVLNVYLQLHQNARTEAIPPLFLTLTIPDSFTDVLESLKSAAESGQGIPHVLQFAEDANEEQYPQVTGESEAGDHAHEVQDEEQYQYNEEENFEDANPGQTDEAYAEADAYDYQGEYETPAQEDSGAEHQEEHYHGEVGDDFDGQDVAHDEGQEQTGEKIAEPDVPGVAEADGEQTLPQPSHQEQAAESSGHGDQKHSSPGSSTTAQGDQGDTTIGECEWEIDWGDDDILTSGPLEVSTDNLSQNFLMDPSQDFGVDTTVKSAIDGDATEAQDTEEEPPLRPEDLLEEFDGEEYDAGDQDPGSHEESYGHEGDYDQADTFEEQQEDYQAGEDEQFHTARDFLNGENHEHGPENESEGDEPADEETTRAEGDGMPHDQSFEEPDELIDFDDDTPAEHEARKVVQSEATAVASNSPFGKRSFQEHVDDELFDDDEPELKKVRSD